MNDWKNTSFAFTSNYYKYNKRSSSRLKCEQIKSDSVRCNPNQETYFLHPVLTSTFPTSFHFVWRTNWMDLIRNAMNYYKETKFSEATCCTRELIVFLCTFLTIVRVLVWFFLIPLVLVRTALLSMSSVFKMISICNFPMRLWHILHAILSRR